MFKNIFTSKNPEQKFWDWFTKNSKSYFNFESDQEKFFDELQAQLGKINSHIVFEFSPIFKNNTREFVISADGIKDAFPAVIKLVEAAPILSSWKITAFRQPYKSPMRINYKNIAVDVKDVYFRYAKDSGKIGVELNIRNYEEENSDWGGAIFLLLDAVIGEYDTEMSLSWIQKKKLNEEEIEKLYPLGDLPQIIATYKQEISN